MRLSFHKASALFLAAACFGAFAEKGYGRHAPTTQAQQQRAPAESAAAALVGKLPPALREKGRELLAEKDENRRADLAETLSKKNGEEAAAFLLADLEIEFSPAVRRAIIDNLGKLDCPAIRRALELHAASDADANVSILALDRLRALRTQEMRQLLDTRLEAARRAGDANAVRSLEAEQERWIALVRGVTLPAFLRVAPPVFAVKPSGQPVVRVLAFGDFGTGSEAQRRLAETMRRAHLKEPFDFALTLGDNFYPNGMTSPTDARWKTQWEDLYSPLGIEFYATFGNHDWYGADSPAAEILYAKQSRTWRMPAPYYTFTAGSAQFFALDTNEMSDAQLRWLNNELTKSRARWRIIYGHHPIFSAAERGDNLTLLQRLFPVIKGRADLYLTGHEHNLQHLPAREGVQFFIVGGGGQKLDHLKKGSRALFLREDYGFAALDIKAKSLKAAFVGADGKTLYEYTLRK